MMVPSRSWMEKRRPSIRNHPRTAETPMAMIMPIDPDMAAFRVSSVICARVSQNPPMALIVSRHLHERCRRTLNDYSSAPILLGVNTK